MVLTDVFLEEMAKALNNESFTTPVGIAFSSSVITPAATDTSLAHEYDRAGLSGTRSTNEVTFSGLRSGAVASSTGDYINLVGVLSTSTTGGNLFVEALVPSVLHTTSFDFEVDATITIERK